MEPGLSRRRVCEALVRTPRGAYPRITIYGREELMKRVVRLLVVLLPLAVLAGTVPASANDEAGYLALGDSVAFGYNPLVFNSNPTDTDAYIGYPEVLSKHVVHASCSGAASGSLLVALTYSVTDYNDQTAVTALGAINQVVAAVTTAFGGRVANGFAAFQREAMEAGGDSCKAGLLIRLPTGGCDIHPSRLGRKLLARAVEAGN